MKPVIEDDYSTAITDPSLVAVLCRQSTTKTRQKNSIPRQLKGLKEWAKEIDWAFPTDSSCFYTAKISGTVYNPELERLMDDLRSGRKRGVMIDDLSRASRLVLKSYQLWDLIKSTGTLLAVRSFRRILDPENNNDEVIVGFEAWMNEAYWQMLGRLSADGSRRRAAQGRWCGGPVPLGFKRIRKGVLAKDDSTKLDITCQLSAASYLSVRQAAKLYQERFGIAVAPATLHNRARNRAYEGAIVYGRTHRDFVQNEQAIMGDLPIRKPFNSRPGDIVVKDGALPTPVERRTSIEAQQRLAERQNNRTGLGIRLNQKDPFTLSGLAFCAVCGNRLKRRLGPRRKSADGLASRYAYAGCWAAGCPNFSRTAEAVELAVVSAIEHLAVSGPSAKMVVDAAVKTLQGESKVKARLLEQRVQELKRACSRLEARFGAEIENETDAHAHAFDTLSKKLCLAEEELGYARAALDFKLDKDTEAAFMAWCGDTAGRWKEFSAWERIVALRQGFSRVAVFGDGSVSLAPRIPPPALGDKPRGS